MASNKHPLPGNQADYGANQKDTPGAKGMTRDGPMDHTYPNAASRQQGNSARDDSGGNMGRADPMHGQQTGGSGTTQGVSDSHQRQMEIHSEAWGKLEQPVGRRQRDSGVSVTADVLNRQGKTQTGDTLNPQDPAHPQLHAEQPGRDGRVPGAAPPEPIGTDAGVPGVQHGDIYGNRQGAQGGADARDDGSEAVHESNDAAGGYPRSPGGANKLAGDRKMDDDTGFSRR